MRSEQHGHGRRDGWGRSIGVLCAAAVVVALTTSTADAAQTVRLTAGPKAVRDSQGDRWLSAGWRLSGKRVQRARYPGSSASPRIYEWVAVGSRRLSLRVPEPGRYAVTVITVDPSRHPPRRQSTFDVLRGRRLLLRATVLRGGSKLSLPLHHTFETVVNARSLRLRFRSRTGKIAIAGIVARKLEGDDLRPLGQLFRDDFQGPQGASLDDARWATSSGFGWGAVELQAYTTRPENVGLDGTGNLVLTARREKFPGLTDSSGRSGDYTSGRVESNTYFSLRRARIRARIQVPAGRGLWPLLFALPAPPAGWPEGGEIDIMEMVGQEPHVNHGFVHGYDPGSVARITHNEAIIRYKEPLSRRFHTYELRTWPDVVEFFLDGRRYGSVIRSDFVKGAKWPLENRFKLVAALAVGGNWPGPPSSTTPFPAQMRISSVLIEG